MDNATAERIAQEVWEKMPKRLASSAFGINEESQRMLDAWIKAGGTPEDMERFGLLDEDDDEEETAA